MAKQLLKGAKQWLKDTGLLVFGIGNVKQLFRNCSAALALARRV